MGNIAMSDELRNAFENKGIEYYELREASPQEFYDAIGNAKKVNEHGAFVTQHSIEEYSSMKKLFVTSDGKAGIAITEDNNIVSIFNGGTKKGVLKTLIPAALENGGNKLDNFNSPKLSAMYELYGFDPVSGTEFNEQFAPEDWNYDRDDKPDIIFWIHNGDDAKDVVLNFGNYIVDWRNVKMFGTYEDARQYRDELLKNLYE